MKKQRWFVPLLVAACVVVVWIFPVWGDPAAGKPIKIGIIGPMELRTGNHLFITAQMAVEKINAAGGVKVGDTRRPIELLKITSNEFKRVPDAVAAAERALTVDKVDFLIGGILPEAVSAIQDVAADNKTLYFSTAYFLSQQYVDRMSKHRDRYKYCFAVASVDAPYLARVHVGMLDVVARAIQKAGIAKVRAAQMVEKTSSTDGAVLLSAAYFKKAGIDLVGVWRPSTSASDLRAETAAIKSSNAHLVYTIFSGAGGIVFGSQMNELKVPALVVGSPASSLFPGKGIEGSVTMMSVLSIPEDVTNQNLAFYHEFLKRSGGELCVMSAHDTIMNLAHNIELAGTLDPDTLIRSLETQEYNGIAGPVKYDSKDHRWVILGGYRAVYGVQHLAGGKANIVWPTDAAVKAKPVQIPPWMIDAWKSEK